MTYSSIYESVRDLYTPQEGWDRLAAVGDRDQLNIAEEAIGRHDDSEETALRIRDFETSNTETYSFAELNAASNQVANYLCEHTEPGDRVGACLPTQFELYAVVFGTIKAGRIYLPLTPLFGEDALSARLDDSGASIVFTNNELGENVAEDLSTLERIVTTDTTATIAGDRVIETYDVVRDEDETFEAVSTSAHDTCILSYTSGTTGAPKGVTMSHGSRLDQYAYLEYVIDLQPTDTYFVTASPSWSYGLMMGTLMPGVRGTAIGCYRGKFTPEALFETLDEWDVDNTMIPPTAIRQARAEEVDVGNYDIDLRVLLSAGETLDKETVLWCEDHLGAPPLDAYGLTEGKMVVCNYSFADWEIKPGSMGKPTPGYEVRLLDGDGNEVDVGEIGEIAFKHSDPNARYWGRPQKTIDMFSGEWMRTGDLAKKDEDEYFWFISRKDSVIISAGYKIGPEEVEETLLKHDAVREAGVTGEPDETRGNIVKAYISLKSSFEQSDELKEEIMQFTRSDLSKHEYPRVIEFVDELPKTSTGKIHRAALDNGDV